MLKEKNFLETCLYQLNSAGKVKMWTIQVRRKPFTENVYEIVTTSGLMHGKRTPTHTAVEIGLGGKDCLQQALSDAQTEINKKIKAGYVRKLDEVKSSTSTATIEKPAKGLPYHPRGGINKITIDGAGIRKEALGVQPKLDGWRLRVYCDGEVCKFYSSSGDLITSFPQIEKEILSKFQKYSDWCDAEEVLLDGELYKHGVPFQTIQSACGTSVNFSSEILSLRNSLEFHIFDIVPQKKYKTEHYSLRSGRIYMFTSGTSFLKEVPTQWIKELPRLTLEDQIEEYFEGCLAAGYEGVIIRRNCPYEHKKSKQFLKYKPLVDDEFVIVGFKKSITGDTLGSIECITINKKQFNADLKGKFGTDEYKKYIWDNQQEFLGKLATVEFMEYTEDGIPRHPRVKSFRLNLDI